MVKKGIALATPSLKDVARRAGLSYHAVRMYSRGERAPSSEIRRKLAGAFRGFAADLSKVADELEAP